MPDYLAIHVYATTFDKFVETVTRFRTAFGLPVLVTEFAMHVGVEQIHCRAAHARLYPGRVESERLTDRVLSKAYRPLSTCNRCTTLWVRPLSFPPTVKPAIVLQGNLGYS
jgi:hypothetical protein